MLLIIWLVTLTVALVLYLRQVYTKLSRSNINHLPIFPGVGNMMPLVLKREHFVDTIMNVYRAFPEDRMVGQYVFLKPAVLIKDIELIKKITVKDFDHFVDRRPFVDEAQDPLFGRNLFSLKGDEWRDMRSTLSPAFTSSKIRLMLPLMEEVADQMIETLKKKIEATRGGYMDVDSKDLNTRFANDVIASCAFGLKVNSIENDNQFYLMGKTVTQFSRTKLFGFLMMPLVMQLLNIKLFPQLATDFFKDVVLGTMKHRDEKNIIRNDMIHLLMEVRKGHLSHDNKSTQDADAGFATVEESSVGKKQVNREWSDDDLVAQAVLFLLAGFETVSTAMSFLLHELALNPDVQDKLVKEIREQHEKSGGKFDYNTVQHMTYLDMVITESLRLWSPVSALDRYCIKDCNLGKPNSQAKEDFIARKGDIIFLPTWAIQRDPEYFPNPDKFDPERFSEENKHNINPFTYMPFGLGPRNCIGSRFALCEVKVMAYKLLLHMEVSPCEKTCIPTKLSASDGFNIKIKGGHWVRMKIRK